MESKLMTGQTPPERAAPRPAASGSYQDLANAGSTRTMRSEDQIKRAADILNLSVYELSQALNAKVPVRSQRQELDRADLGQNSFGRDGYQIINRSPSDGQERVGSPAVQQPRIFAEVSSYHPHPTTSSQGAHADLESDCHLYETHSPFPAPSSSRTITQVSATTGSQTLSNRSTPFQENRNQDDSRELRYLVEHGPCSNLWTVPKAGRGNRAGASRGAGKKRKRLSPEDQTDARPTSRGPFQDSAKRLETAETRQKGACVRCFMQKIRCEINPQNPDGACKTCLQLKQSITRLPCLRYKITDASLFREQKAPNPFYSKRWDSMEIKDISGWASERTKTIKLTHGFGQAEYTLELREFQPVEGDLLEEVWYDGLTRKAHPIPPYAIANMSQAAREITRYVENSIAVFVVGTVGEHDPSFPFLWQTYWMAFRHAHESPRYEERTLLLDALRLWVTSRMTSLPEWIGSDEKVGTRVEDRSSPYYGTVPVAPVICAQLEVITYSQLQRPLRKRVLDGLAQMMRVNDRRNWFTIYLTLFILLHSCSMTTKRDQEYATQMAMTSRYANPKSISEHHVGMMTMLAYFHYCNKGRVPFELASDPAKAAELAAVAALNEDQMAFVRQTAEWIKAKRKNPIFQQLLLTGIDLRIGDHVKRIREEKDCGDHYYFISQLFDADWRPTATA
ncbi:uncharacterized protein BKCO1_6600048 [Diplodia corticola]|uniref:Zn(2)-C6 fungal-type domain-containing protein n=1 Tax=Diplodia corticola TaxID=236234 RepID=A0A1J9QQ04_9PEZI|nr:uncharacterized protein BKCO1_6600048 [Diplodia corticola]OJD30106.1 hypothetical protein BKCO1_6600048 [Diplodia corticola]